MNNTHYLEKVPTHYITVADTWHFILESLKSVLKHCRLGIPENSTLCIPHSIDVNIEEL